MALGSAPRAYLDFAATAPIDPAAVEASVAAARAWANPSSMHSAGQRARSLLDRARRQLADAFGCTADSIVFTSGGTEALGLVLRGDDAASTLISAVEHPAVRLQARAPQTVSVNRDGRLELAALERMLAAAPAPALVAVMHANNETGVLQPVAEAAELAKAAGARLLVDAVQTAGKLPLPAADYLAVSAHKLGGPPGVGALIARDLSHLAALQRGGGQERGMRAGTENLPGIAGFAAAAAARAADPGWHERARALRDRLEQRLLESGVGVEVVGARSPRLGTISSLRLPGVAGPTQLINLDLAGFEVSAGAACSSGKVAASHVLAAMGYGEGEAGEVIRVSLGWTTTADEVDRFVEAYLAMARRLGRRAA